ncbi:MAG TPA: heme-binding protein [Caulobacteraceae bacterium]|nr:heme-binding protein [Caulobacteraceae bacterium]
MKVLLGVALALVLGGAASAQAPTAQNDPAAPINNGGPSGPPGHDPVAKGLTADQALTVAKAAVAGCAEFHIGIAILDQAGLPKLYYVPDGTAGFHAYTAFRKANTAYLIKAPSEDIRARMAADPEIAAKVKSGNAYLYFPGGLPIMKGGEMIGAIGISGAEPGGNDKKCATAGLKAIADQLQ